MNPDVEISEESLAEISSFNHPNEQTPADLRYPWVVGVAADDTHYKPADHVGAWEQVGPTEEAIGTIQSCCTCVFGDAAKYGGETAHYEMIKGWVATLMNVQYAWVVCAPGVDRFYEGQNVSRAVHARSTALLLNLEQQVDLIYGFKV